MILITIIGSTFLCVLVVSVRNDIIKIIIIIIITIIIIKYLYSASIPRVHKRLTIGIKI